VMIFIVAPCMLIVLSTLFVQLMHTNYYKIVLVDDFFYYFLFFCLFFSLSLFFFCWSSLGYIFGCDLISYGLILLSL
jgi:hypothetical protein